MLFIWETKTVLYLENKVLTLKILNFCLPPVHLNICFINKIRGLPLKCFHKWTDSTFFTIIFVKVTIDSNLHCCSLLRSLLFFFFLFCIFREGKLNWSYWVNPLLKVFVRDLNAKLLESFTSLSLFYFDLTFSKVPSGRLAGWPSHLQQPNSWLKPLCKLFPIAEEYAPPPRHLVSCPGDFLSF